MANTQALATPNTGPVVAARRIESLDVLRGVALLGVLLLNILGFGLASVGYYNPLAGMGDHKEINYAIWGIVNLFFEGSMRGLFSLLFGAGVVMFTTGIGSKSGLEKGAKLHYRRTFFLLLFGMFDAYVLLWTGDILMVYAMAGALLYPLRHVRPRNLIIISAAILLFSTVLFTVSGTVMGDARDAASIVEENPNGNHSQLLLDEAALWDESKNTFEYNETAVNEELEIRRGSYGEVASYTAKNVNEKLLFFTPVFMLWDAMGMMILGMAMYRLGILSAARSSSFYARMMVGGFTIGLAVNGFELLRAVQTDYDPIVITGYFQSTYQLGRIGMAAGWLGAVMLLCQSQAWSHLRARLAAVGRTALSNYLLHSVICLVLFTGVGFGLVGVLERWALYAIVIGIWSLQLFLSPWWLNRFAFGPAEWLWRTLTYGTAQRWKIH